VILVLGVLDVAYSDANSDGAKTTGDVAEGLENGFGEAHGKGGFHIMQKFFDSRKEKIAGWLADSMAQAIENLTKSGQRIDTAGRESSAEHVLRGMKRSVSGVDSGSLTYSADQKIEAEFRAFIFSSEMQSTLTAAGGGSISAAADAGVNHRKAKPYAKANKARPAFVDTGLYVASMRAWTTEGKG